LLAKKGNNLNWIEFRNALIEYKVFSTGDARKYFPGFDTKRLVEWQKKNYIRKLINKWYLFSEVPPDELLLFRISNCLYQPSYVSLESALGFYHFIPEAVYSMQAITTRKTISYKTKDGTFNYRTLKPAFYFGYRILHKDNLPVLVAEPEKALLDYLYLTASLNTLKDMKALRFNYPELNQQVDWKKLDAYAQVFKNKTLDKRIKHLKKLSLHAHPA
jgi:predicted transcriptional regulator of viral defense system